MHPSREDELSIDLHDSRLHDEGEATLRPMRINGRDMPAERVGTRLQLRLNRKNQRRVIARIDACRPDLDRKTVRPP